MSDRSRALEILRRARDLLAERLTERILDCEEGLLDDARGETYLSDIDSLFDQFGTKLAHLNQMINNLPLETEVPPPDHDRPPLDTGVEFASTAPDSVAFEELTALQPLALPGPLLIVPPALPAPRVGDEPEVPLPSLHRFVIQVRDDQLLDAARTLAVLLDISEARGMQCVRIFSRRVQDDEAFLLKVLQLRGEVVASSYNAALMLLAECFGLVGIEAIGVLQALRTRYIETE